MKKTIIASLVVSAITSAQAFDLKILHINDHHSHIEPNKKSLKLADKKVYVKTGGMGILATLFAEHSKEGNVLKLHAGDAITGDIYYTLTKGASDAAVMNEICFDAFVVGNHEFDGGDTGLKFFLDELNKSSCATPSLGANVKPEAGVSPLTPKDGTPYLKPYVIKEVGGEKIGIVGIVIGDKTKNSSSPDETTMFEDEIATSQKYIDELKSKGVQKIVLLTHNQYDREVAMASELTDVDVIVGGDSHTLLGEQFKDYGLSPKGKYPTVTKNKDGKTTCVVQAWQYSEIFGELNVTFEGNDVTSCSGTPIMPLADSFLTPKLDDKGEKVKDESGSTVYISYEGDTLAAIKQAVTDSPVLEVVAEDKDMKAIVDKYKTDADKLKNEKVATVTETLCLERIPGQGYRDCDKANFEPSDISVVVAEAFLRQSKLADFAIQNAGGVRESIAEGDFTTGHAYKLLPFANTLVELQMTGEEVKSVLEEALDYAYNGSTGAYPYGAGLRFDVNAVMPKGRRIAMIEVKDKQSGKWNAMDMTKTYTVVTNDYIAGGKDGYTTFGEVSKDSSKYVDTYLDYAQSFVDYVKAKGEFGKVATGEHSTKSYSAIYNSGQNITGFWWDPSQDGQGVTIKDSLDGAVVSGAIYTYDDSGKAVWYTMILNWMATKDGTEKPTATGELNKCTGTPNGQAWDKNLNKCESVGSATLIKQADDKVDLDLTLSGKQKSFALVPFYTILGKEAKRIKHDNFYWDATTDGQGLYLSASTFNDKKYFSGAWYRYDDKGESTWYYLDGKQAEGDKFAISYNLIAVEQQDGKKVNKTVGTATFTPSSLRAGEFKYTLDGKEGTLKLESFDF